MKRADIVKEAKTYLGVDWVHQGRSRKGVDCVGLVVLVLNGLGAGIEDFINYPARPDGSFLDNIRKHGKEKPVRDRKNGDVLVFAGRRHDWFCHTAFYFKEDDMEIIIHAPSGIGKVVEETFDQANATIGRPRFCFEPHGIED